MDYASLGRSGIKVSKICLGTMSFGNSEDWMLEIDAARPIVKRALDLGINFFDTANVYSSGRSEEIVGELLAGCRNQVVIATKVRGRMSPAQVGGGPNAEGLSRAHIMRQIEGSLERLKARYVDLYQIHRWDYSTPIEETLGALGDLVHSGKVNYIGASSMFAWQFAKSLFTSDLLGLPRFIAMQNQYNLCYREEEREMIPLCIDQGVALIPWSPLARGFLSGRYKRGVTPDSKRFRGDSAMASRFFRPEDFDVLEAVEEVAKERGVTPSIISLAWLMQRGVTSPIIGATKVSHVEEAVQALEVRLSPEEMRRLESSYKLRAVSGHS